MKKKVLLIDDEELITRTLANALEKQGYEIMVAKNGEDGIVMSEEEDFDLIICDIRMPGLNGVETIRSIKAVVKNRGAKVPTIFITGYADQSSETEAKALSPTAYFYKPFDLVEFLTRVKDVLGGQ